MSQIAYQYERATGLYVGPVECDPHPLRPNEFIMPADATQVPPPMIPAGKRARWFQNAWQLVNAPASAPVPPPLTPEEELAREREGMNVFAKAFFDALALFPAAGYLHLLDQYTQTIALLRANDPYDAIVRWNDRVTILQRAHPDMAVVRDRFAMTDPLLDLIFQAALMIEAGVELADVEAAVDAGILEMTEWEP